MSEDKKSIYSEDILDRRRKLIKAWLNHKPKKAAKHKRKLIQDILKNKQPRPQSSNEEEPRGYGL